MSKHESAQIDTLLSNLAKRLKQDPTDSASLFVDLLAEERLKSRDFLSKVVKYSLCLNIVLGVIVWVLAFPRTEFKVAQQRLDGTLAEIAVSNKPYYRLLDIKNFAQTRAMAMHSWTYKNYPQVFEDERAFWDTEPLEDYVSSLLGRGVFSNAEAYRTRFQSNVPTPPKVLQQIKYDGDYRIYRVEMVLQDEAVDIEGVDSKAWKIVMDVREVTPDEGWAGLKVTRFDEVVVK